MEGLQHLLGDNCPFDHFLLHLLPDLHVGLQFLHPPLHHHVALHQFLRVQRLVLQLLDELVVLEEGETRVVAELVAADRQQVALHFTELVHHF
jgi:hypothetical protein